MIRPIVPKQNKEVILSYVLDRHLHQNLLEEGEVDAGEVDVGEVEVEAVEEEAVGEEAVVPAVLVLVVLYYNFPPNSWKREIFGDFHIIPVADSGKPPIV